MTTKAQLRKTALRLPETEERTHFGMAAFYVADKGFASVTANDEVQLRLPAERVSEFQDEHGVGEALRRGDTLIGLRVRLADVNGMVLNALVTAAWRHRAPRRLAARIDGAEAGTDELPAGIGDPARRALREAGVTSLSQLSGWTAERLLELHGVGPKAVTALSRALAEHGLRLR